MCRFQCRVGLKWFWLVWWSKHVRREEFARAASNVMSLSRKMFFVMKVVKNEVTASIVLITISFLVFLCAHRKFNSSVYLTVPKPRLSCFVWLSRTDMFCKTSFSTSPEIAGCNTIIIIFSYNSGKVLK